MGQVKCHHEAPKASHCRGQNTVRKGHQHRGFCIPEVSHRILGSSSDRKPLAQALLLDLILDCWIGCSTESVVQLEVDGSGKSGMIECFHGEQADSAGPELTVQGGHPPVLTTCISNPRQSYNLTSPPG